MPDPADLAQDSIEQQEEIRDRQRKAMLASKSISDECVECDEPISAARQKATGGTDLCVICQHRMETQAKHLRQSGW